MLTKENCTPSAWNLEFFSLKLYTDDSQLICKSKYIPTNKKVTSRMRKIMNYIIQLWVRAKTKKKTKSGLDYNIWKKNY